jgi:hypothetical protein
MNETPNGTDETTVRALLRSAATGAPGTAAVDVPRVLSRSRGRRRARRLATAGVGTAVVVAAAGTLYTAAILPGRQPTQVLSEPGAPTPAEPAPGASGGGSADPAAGGGAAGGISLAPPEKTNPCGAPLADMAPSESGLVATPSFPGTATTQSDAVEGSVLLTNTGTTHLVGWTGARPVITVAENGITVWHSNGPVIQLAQEIDLEPGASMVLAASFTPVRCDAEDETREDFRPDLPALPAGVYALSAIVPFYAEDGSAVQYVGGPFTSITLQ